jgi:hypothetical protein
LIDNVDDKSWLIFFSPLFGPLDQATAFVALRKGGGWDLCIAERGSMKSIYQSETVVRLLGWTPSGKELVIENGVARKAVFKTTGPVELLRISLDGNRQLITTLAEAHFMNARLSHDGRHIACATRDGGSDQIQIIEVANGKSATVAQTGDPLLFYSTLSWAPDGKTIYYGKQQSTRAISIIENFR